MAIFNKRPSAAVSKNTVAPTMESIAFIVMEQNENYAKLIQSMYAADIIIERKVALEGANERILVEATIKELWEKFIKNLKSLKDKIVAWITNFVKEFKKVIDLNLQFVKMSEKKLLEIAKTKSKKVQAYKYDVETVFIKVKGEFGSGKLSLDKYKDGEKTREDFLKALSNAFDLSSETPTSKDLKAALIKACKSEKKEEIVINGSTIGKLIAAVKEKANYIAKVEDSKKKFMDNMTKAISICKEMQKKDDVDGASVQKRIAALNAITSYYTVAITTVVSLYKADARLSGSLLRNFLLGKKESAEEMEGEESTDATPVENIPIVDENTEEEILDGNIDEETMDQMVEAALEVEGQDDQEIPAVEPDAEDMLEEAKEEETVEDPNSVLSEALRFF